MEAKIVGTDHQASTGSRRRIALFIAVGCAAALVHFCVVVMLVRLWAAPPLAANVGGWLVAFIASFGGHFFLTFRDTNARFAQALGRFALVSACAFAINEIAYAVLLKTGQMRYDAAL
jgi:putative flippase GtrA